MKKLLITLLTAFTACVAGAQTSVTVSGIMVDTVKVFDANDTALVISHGVLSGVQPSHTVYPLTEAHYASIDADSGITINVTTTLHGADSALYMLDNPTMTLSGIINKRQLYRDSIVLMPFKIYDGMLECPIQFTGIARNYVTHHILTTIDSCVFLDPNVGDNKPVRLVFGMNGEDEDNYIPPRDTVLYSSIIKRKLTTKAPEIEKVKTYDGTADAVVTSRGWLRNIIEDDTVHFNFSARYDDKNAGTGKNIRFHYDIYGPDTMNYSAPDDGLMLNCEILHIQLTADGGQAEKSKLYDGTTDCNVTVPSQPVGVLSGERVFLNTMAAYDNPSVGTGHVITFSYTIYGDDFVNYIAPEDSVYCNDGEIYEETGVGDVTISSTVSPVPCNDYVEVQCAVGGNHHIIIYNVYGQMLYNEEFEGESVRIDVASLTSGVYMIAIDGKSCKMIKK